VASTTFWDWPLSLKVGLRAETTCRQNAAVGAWRARSATCRHSGMVADDLKASSSRAAAVADVAMVLPLNPVSVGVVVHHTSNSRLSVCPIVLALVFLHFYSCRIAAGWTCCDMCCIYCISCICCCMAIMLLHCHTYLVAFPC
jgi:hypothetical protein